MAAVRMMRQDDKDALNFIVAHDKHQHSFVSEPHMVVMHPFDHEGRYAVMHINDELSLSYGYIFDSEIEAEDEYDRVVDCITVNQRKGRM